MLRYTISILALLVVTAAEAQSESIDLRAKDTVVYMESYGIRFGIDLSKQILNQTNKSYSGLEIMGDLRLNQWIYVAAELGTEKKTIFEDLYSYTPSGQYLKVGIDYNSYENWYGMSNAITLGGRIATSIYSTEVNEFNFYNTDRYWNQDVYDPSNQTLEKITGINALWLEFVLGIKTEIYNNLYLTASVRGGIILKHNKNLNSPNNWVPGFNNITEESRFGGNYNYGICYHLPLFKRPKKYRKEKAYLPVGEEGEEIDLNNNPNRNNRNNF